MAKISSEELEYEAAILENIKKDFLGLGKNLIKSIQQGKSGSGMRPYGEIYQFTYQWLSDAGAFSIYIRPKKRVFKVPIHHI